MAPRRKTSRRPARPGRAGRRRLIRAAGVLAGAALAAGGGWLYAGPQLNGHDHASPARPTTARAPLPFGLPAPEPSVQGGALQVPVVDVAEVLPTCHN